MEDKVNSYPQNEENQNRVNEPEIGYSVVKSDFEKDWQRGVSVNEFRKCVFEKLKAVYEQN